MKIRIDSDAVHQSQAVAVSVKKTLRQWLEEAIAERIERERGQDTKQGLPASPAFLAKGEI
ncbi:MAG: hypothetical protein ACE5JU_24265 [Candidatus Binatia bacterium]